MTARKRPGDVDLSPAQQREIDFALECDRTAAAMPAPAVATADEIAILAMLTLRWTPKDIRAFLKVSREAADAIAADPGSLTRRQRESIAWLMNMGHDDTPHQVQSRAIAARLLATLPSKDQ